jgi:hypothetical protein
MRHCSYLKQDWIPYVPARDGNNHKQSIGGQIIFIFTCFSQKQNRYDIVENEYGTVIYYGNFENDNSWSVNTSITIEIYENDIHKNDKHAKP